LNERLRILKLLEEGKINADEAERLLKALNECETGRRRPHHRFWNSMEIIPEIITSTIAGPFKHFTTKEELQFPRKNRIEFRGISGNIIITGKNIDNIQIDKEGFAKIREADDTLEIKAISGDITISAPKNIDIEIKGVSGNLDIEGVNGKIGISSVSGEIDGKELSGSFKGDFVSGDVSLEYKNIEGIDIKSKTGNITLRLDENVEAEIEIETKYGNIDCEFELKEGTRKRNYLKGIIKDPKAKIEIRNEYGSVAIVKG